MYTVDIMYDKDSLSVSKAKWQQFDYSYLFRYREYQDCGDCISGNSYAVVPVSRVAVHENARTVCAVTSEA